MSLSSADSERLDAARTAAVREAFWAGTPAAHPDYEILRDALIYAGLAASPSPAQVRALLFALPDHVVGAAVSWGFTDTDVREQMWAFVDERRAEIRRAVGAANAR